MPFSQVLSVSGSALVYETDVGSFNGSLRSNPGGSSSVCSSIRQSIELSTAAASDPVNIIEDPRLLRGVPASRLLHRCGALLSIPPDGWQYALSEEDAAELYNSSREVPGLDWFISHCWQNSRWLKYAAILWTVNLRKALCYANAAAAVWAIATFIGPMPTWKREYILFNELFETGACIHQTDPVRKALGIKSLGGFLRNSDRILVLWSKNYFERLWCNYEIACFASLHDLRKIDFVPLNFLGAFLTLYLLSLISQIYWIWRLAHQEASHVTKVFDVCYQIVWTFVYSRAMRTRISLVSQLEHFTLANSKCYCCSMGHVVPSTGRRILCDREFVESNIKRWFGELARDDDVDGLATFERTVRELLGRNVRAFLGPYCVPLSLIGPFFFCHCWSIIDKMVGFVDSDITTQILNFGMNLQRVTVLFLQLPLISLVTPYVNQRLRRVLPWQRSWPVDIISALFATIVSFALLSLVSEANRSALHSDKRVLSSVVCTLGMFALYSMIHKLSI